MPQDRTDQHRMRDPHEGPKPPFPPQRQDEPGLTEKMRPRPDHGEHTYKGARRLSGRKALITGGDSGIGRAVAIAYAREGAEVAINYLPAEEEDAQSLKSLLEDEGSTLHCLPGDLMDEAFCVSLIDDAEKRMGGLDTLVINAGKQVSQQDIADITTEQFDQTMKTNIYAMFWLSKAALPKLPKGGTIINVTSVQGYDPSPNLLDYATTKYAIRGFTQGLAEQVADKGIRVNAVAPGPFWTPLQPSEGQPPEKVEHFGEGSPFGRPGQPAEIAPTFVFLASGEANYISGEIIAVTGGKPAD